MNEQNTAEIDGTKYIVTKDGENLILSPVKEHRHAKEGDVIVGPIQGYCVVLGEDASFLRGGIELAATESVPFNIFDVLNGDYVKKQDVIDALSLEDGDGDSVLGFIFDGPGVFPEGREGAAIALTALGITPKP